MRTGDFKDDRLAAIKDEPPTVYPINEGDIESRMNCPICYGSPTTLSNFYVGGFPCAEGVLRTAICVECGHVWRMRHPDDAWFAETRDRLNADSGISGEYWSSVSLNRRAAHVERFNYICGFNAGGFKNCLDIGGRYDAWAGTAALPVDSMTVVNPALSPARIHKTLYVSATIEKILSMSEALFPYYDLVIASHVLEHLEDPVSVLQRLKSRLSADCLLYVEVPHVLHIVNWSDAMYLAHRHNFCAGSFEAMAARAGYEIIAQRLNTWEENRPDMGFVLRPSDTEIKSREHSHRPDADFIDRVRARYRLGLPAEIARAIDSVYIAPHIDHFNYGLRFDRWRAKVENGHIMFEE